MYAVQLFIDRKYQTVDGPTSLDGAFDNYAAHVRNKAPLDTMVRLVKVVKGSDRDGRGMKVVALRSGKALALPIAAYFVPSTEVKNNPLPTAIKRLVPHSKTKKSVRITGKNHTARKAG